MLKRIVEKYRLEIVLFVFYSVVAVIFIKLFVVQ